MNLKAQSATEYLIMLATILVIAMIGLALIRFIPKIGTHAEERSDQLALRSLPVGIINYAFKPTNTTLVLKNNRDATISISNITAHNISFAATTFPVILYPNDEQVLTTTRLKVAQGTYHNYAIIISYMDEQTQQRIRQNTTITGTSS